MKRIELLKEELAAINDHIMHDCTKEPGPWLRHLGINKGKIFECDEMGKVFNIIKENVKYDELKAAGKVNEVTIDESWTPLMTKSAQNDNATACWNKLVSAAYKANHGLLVLNVSNIKLFQLCWHLKQLAKQEKPLLLWPANDIPFENMTSEDLIKMRDELVADNDKLNAEKIMELINGFDFDGYVMILLNGISLNEMISYAEEHCHGEWNAMISCFYRCYDKQDIID